MQHSYILYSSSRVHHQNGLFLTQGTPLVQFATLLCVIISVSYERNLWWQKNSQSQGIITKYQGPNFRNQAGDMSKSGRMIMEWWGLQQAIEHIPLLRKAAPCHSTGLLPCQKCRSKLIRSLIFPTFKNMMLAAWNICVSDKARGLPVSTVWLSPTRLSGFTAANPGSQEKPHKVPLKSTLLILVFEVFFYLFICF